MAASSAIYSNTFALPTAPTAASRSQQSFRSGNQQQWAHHDHLQPSGDSPAFMVHSVFAIGAAIAMGSAVRKGKRKQKTSTLRFAAKVVATAPVAKKNVPSTTDKTGNVRRPYNRPVLSDPDAPKRPLTVFFRYYLDFRKGPEAKGTATAVAAGAKWKTLSVAKRGQWQKPYDEERQKYQKARQKYVNSGKRDAWYRDPAKPKRPLTGYIRFIQERREKYADLPMTEQVRKLASKWTALEASKKELYNKAFTKDAKAYKRDMEAYKASGKEDEWLKKVGITAAREKAEAKKKAAKLKVMMKKKEVAATIKEKAAKAKAKAKAMIAGKKSKAVEVQKQLSEKQRVKPKPLAERVKAGAAKKIAADKKAKELQTPKLAAAKLKEKAPRAKAKGAVEKPATVALVTKKTAKDKAEVAPKNQPAVVAQKVKAASAKVEEGLKKKVVTAKLKAETVKAKAKSKKTAVKA